MFALKKDDAKCEMGFGEDAFSISINLKLSNHIPLGLKR